MLIQGREDVGVGLETEKWTVTYFGDNKIEKPLCCRGTAYTITTKKSAQVLQRSSRYTYARSRLGNISATYTHGTGPQLAEYPMTNKLENVSKTFIND